MQQVVRVSQETQRCDSSRTAVKPSGLHVECEVDNSKKGNKSSYTLVSELNFYHIIS